MLAVCYYASCHRLVHMTLRCEDFSSVHGLTQALETSQWIPSLQLLQAA